jgi:hypothetical protein
MKKSNPTTPTSKVAEAQTGKTTPKPSTITTPSLRDILIKSVADLREGRGSTATSIYNYFTAHFRTGDASPSTVNRELHKAVEDGLLKHPEERERDRYELSNPSSTSKISKQLDSPKKFGKEVSPKKVAQSPLVKTRQVKRIGKLDREIKVLETPGGTKIARIGKKPETPKVKKSPVKVKSPSPAKRETKGTPKKAEEKAVAPQGKEQKLGATVEALAKQTTPAAKRVAVPRKRAAQSSSPKKATKKHVKGVAQKPSKRARQTGKSAKEVVTPKKVTPKKKSRLSLPKSRKIVKTKLTQSIKAKNPSPKAQKRTIKKNATGSVKSAKGAVGKKDVRKTTKSNKKVPTKANALQKRKAVQSKKRAAPKKASKPVGASKSIKAVASTKAKRTEAVPKKSANTKSTPISKAPVRKAKTSKASIKKKVASKKKPVSKKLR